MKRGLIRRLEAALYTLCLPGEQARELKASIPEVSVVAGKEQEYGPSEQVSDGTNCCNCPVENQIKN